MRISEVYILKPIQIYFGVYLRMVFANTLTYTSKGLVISKWRDLVFLHQESVQASVVQEIAAVGRGEWVNTIN